MAVRVTQGALDFAASIDTESFDTGINKITGDLKKVQDEAGKSGEKLNQDFAKKFQSSMNEVSESSTAGRNAIGGLTESVTSLINPTSLITAGVTAAGLAIYKYATSASQAAKDQKTLSDIIDQASKEYGKSAGEIDILKDKLNDLSIPLKDRVDIGKQYNDIATKANQIDLTQLNNLDLINSKIEAQIKLLKDRALARAAENVVSEKAENLFKLQLEFDTKFPELNSKRVETLTQNAVDAVNEAKKRLGNLVKGKVDVNELLNFADLPDSEIQKLAQKNDKFKILLDDNTKNILTAVNHQLQAIDEYKKGAKAGGGGASILQGMINQAQDDLNHTLSIASGLFTPDKIESKISPKDVDPKNDKMNTILEERKRLLQSITDLQREASQSGLSKEQSELDKINERYDAAIKKLQDYNSKKDEFNKKNPNANIPGFTDADFAKLTAARNIELANTTDKQDAAKYIQTIALKREAFDKFEEYQKQHLALKANDMYKSELDGFTTYLDYINSEIKRITALPQTVGTLNEINALEKARGKEIEVQAERARTQAIQDFKNLLDSTKNYYSERDAINQRYDEKEKTLQKNQSLFTIGEYKIRSNALKQGRQDELKNLQDNLFYQTEAYRLMNTNILTLSREGAKKVVSELKDILKSGFTVDSVTGLKI
ncbi:MAG TPA: hypothetical protein VFF23_00140, partial [Hanamia sp.]|nr:hypothetical protein [Hanamia sp.]